VRRLAITCLALLGCASPAPAPRPSTPRPPSLVTSNILRADYAGSRACADCHANLFREQQRSPMHNMTRLPAAAEVQAPFAGELFRFKDDSVRMLTVGGERFMRVESGSFGTHTFRVTKVIGGHHREDFAGVEVADAATGAAVIGDARHERVLPASYFLGTRAWRYKGYSVMVRERPGLKVGGVWNQMCIFCHNTVPYLSTILGALAGPGAGAYQGEVVDPLLPEARRWSFQITDERGLDRALTSELAVLGSSPKSGPLARQAVKVTRNNFDESHLIEIGIGCESCHGGAREHVADFNVRPSLLPRSPLLRVNSPTEPTRAMTVNRACARCHQVLFSRYPYTWEGGLRAQNPGGSNINSGEARDFLLGGCADRMSCVDCHDPHAHDNRARMDALELDGDRVCLRCHAKYAGDAQKRAHSHHAPASATCIDCHMPKKNMSLDNRLTRYHRIGSPTDPARVERDRPLECALCHGDRSVEALVTAMERWWGRTYDRAALQQNYGELSRNVLEATLASGKPHEQAVALALIEKAKARSLAPLVAAQLTHEVPIVRYYAERALAALLGGEARVDVHASAEAIRARAAEWLAGAGLPPAATTATGGPSEAADAPDE
jgi:predicted CXXCH cytochrome family protein